MNSDFMQQQGELIARRVASEADNTGANPEGLPDLIFGRAASDAEVKAGLAFLHDRAAQGLRRTEKPGQGRQGDEGRQAKDSKKDSGADPNDAADDDEKAGEGMMAGVIPGSAKKDEGKKLLPATPWGRYVKILLSSSEFLFVD